VVGHAPAYLADKLGFLTTCVAEYGEVVRLRIGEPTLLLAGAENIQHVLTGNPANYGKTPRLTDERGKRLSGAGMQTAQGAAHLRQRRLLQPEFQPRAAGRFQELMRGRAERVVDGWTDGLEVNLAWEMERLALGILIGAVFGAHYRDEGERLLRAITARRAYLEYYYSWLAPRPEYWPVPVVLRYRRARTVIETAIEQAMAAGEGGGGFAAAYAGLRYPDGAAMDAPLLHDEILALLSTGYETIGDALTWTLYLLAKHPDVEARVLEEIREGTADALPYARMVLEESMRLYPPTWIFVRKALGPDRLPDGTAVEPGTKIYLCPYVTHRLAKYFPNPERFDPERFRPEVRAGRPRFAYFPFGGGQRICIGENFAMQEGLTVLATLLPRYRVELLESEPIVPRTGITLRPRQLRVRLRRR
jgi:cytochrome P450